jgi:Mn2+/Fe2+ NRAMP family transporter
MKSDPYLITNQYIADAPTKFREKIKHLGPGFILSASIVGSGELIATTTLGAKAGFVTFWVILVSCVVKVALQLEFGKHAIHSGETVMVAFNKLPGKYFRKAHWSIWAWMGLMTFKLIQVGGIVGGVALVLKIAFPDISIAFLAFGIALVVALMVFRGYYRFVESTSVVMMGLFTLFTLLCLIFLQYTPYALDWDDIQHGMGFKLPAAAVGVAIGAFGITGVGGDEILYYNYWCIEKGYASKTGIRDESPEWLARAKGWINIMYWDALLAMVGYTLVTAFFYLLGAAILNKMGQVPEGYETIEVLSNIFTESLGPWAKPVFLIGSFIVLFSTLFAALASWIRIYTDAFGQVGWIDFNNLKHRKITLSILAFIFPIAWAVAFLLIKMPVFMVLTGGIIGSAILFLVIYVSIHFRFNRLPKSLKPGILYDLAFGLSVVSIGLVGFYGIWQLL